MSRSDEERLVEKELAIRKGNLKGKELAERLVQIADKEKRDPGTHHTSIDKWTCSCPSYLTSRFLLCKHLVRQANISLNLNGKPCTDLRFFSKLCRARHAPFYSIPGIHGPELEDNDRESEDDQQTNILVLGGYTQGARTRCQEGSGRLRSEMPSPRKERTGKDTESGSLGLGRQEPENRNHTTLPREQMTVAEDPDDGETRVRKLAVDYYVYNRIPDRFASRLQVHFSPSKILHLKRCFDDILDAAASPTGIHPKMGSVFDNVFRKVEEVGGDIGKDKRRRRNPQTGRDSTRNTLYLD